MTCDWPLIDVPRYQITEWYSWVHLCPVWLCEREVVRFQLIQIWSEPGMVAASELKTKTQAITVADSQVIVLTRDRWVRPDYHLGRHYNSKLLKLAKIFSHVSIIEIVNNRLLFIIIVIIYFIPSVPQSTNAQET